MPLPWWPLIWGPRRRTWRLRDFLFAWWPLGVFPEFLSWGLSFAKPHKISRRIEVPADHRFHCRAPECAAPWGFSVFLCEECTVASESPNVSAHVFQDTAPSRSFRTHALEGSRRLKLLKAQLEDPWRKSCDQSESPNGAKSDLCFLIVLEGDWCIKPTYFSLFEHFSMKTLFSNYMLSKAWCLLPPASKHFAMLEFEFEMYIMLERKHSYKRLS
jgi:hypothetical protein